MMKNKIYKDIKSLLIAACTLLFVSCWGNIDVYAAQSGEIELNGNGTRENPYLVSSVDDLNHMRNVINSGDSLVGKWFALTDDIDFEGQTIEPLVDQGQGRTFQGGFDGKGHTISNFVIEEDTESGSFFGRLDGVVENLNLEGTISGSVSATFAQDGYGLIINCISGSKIHASKAAAGIVNNWNGTLENVVFQGTLDAASAVGIVGSGNGAALQVYAKGYEVGSPTVISSGGTFDEQISADIISALNASAQQLFLSSDYGKWLNKWELGKKIKFSDEIAAFEGTGTERNPFVIDSSDKLKVMADFINAGFTFDHLYLYQTADIDLSDEPWTELLDDSAVFSGVYDGNDHTISNLNTGGNTGGLFKNFNGKILNLRLVNCQTVQGSGFAGKMGGASLILNCYLDGVISDVSSLSNLQQTGQLVNSYITGFVEPSIDELNTGLTNLVVNYGIHCGELYTWTMEGGTVQFGVNYKDVYLAKDRKYWNGSGVEKNPYLISSIEDFVYLRESVYYTENFYRHWFFQTEDIDFSDVRYWRAIADESSTNIFYGNYNGNGHKLMHFHPNETDHVQSKSIFGNVNGSVFNVYVTDYQSNGGGNGILANYVAATGKIFNNVIELSDDSTVTSALGIVNANDGRVRNHIVVRPDQLFGVAAALSNGAVNRELKTPQTDGNQIVTKLSKKVVNAFNEGIVDTALQMDQRITNFNSISYKHGKLSLHNPIFVTSPLGLSFLKGMLLNNPLLLFAVLWTLGLVLFIVYKIIRRIFQKTGVSTRTLLQMITLLCIYFVFFLAMQSLRPDAVNTMEALAANVVLAIVFGICVYVLIRRMIKQKGREKFIVNGDWVKKRIPLLVSLAFPAIVGVLHLDTPVAYDSDLYYGSFVQAVENFHFSVTGILDSFSIASKPMHGVAIFMTIGEALAPGTARGVYICNLVLLLLSQMCVYQIIRKLFSNISSNAAVLLALCYAFSGYVLVGATYINPDFYAVVTFAIFLWCILFDYKVFAVFSGFMVICSKPNMIVAYAVFGLIIFIYECIHKKMKLSKWMLYTLPAAVYLILYFGSNSLNRAGVPIESNNEFVFTIGSRVFQYVAYGFIWVQEIFIIAAIVVLIKNKRFYIFRSFKGAFLFAVWLTCFSQFLVTVIGGSTLQLCPRYLTICAIKNILLFAMAIDVLSMNRVKQYAVTGTLAGLLFIQLFTTIDPVILVTTEEKSDDLHYLIFPKKDEFENDLTFYNYEYCKDARNGSKILASLTEAEIGSLYGEAHTPYKMAVGNSFVYPLYWDTARDCRTYIQNENCVRLNMDSIADGLNVRERYRLDQHAVILRNTEDIAIRAGLEKLKESEKIGAFTVYRAKEE